MKTLKVILTWLPIALVFLIGYDYLAFYFQWPSLGLGLMENSFMGLLWFFAILPIAWFVLRDMFPDLYFSIHKELKHGTKWDQLNPKDRVEWGLRVLLVLICVLAYLVRAH